MVRRLFLLLAIGCLLSIHNVSAQETTDMSRLHTDSLSIKKKPRSFAKALHHFFDFNSYDTVYIEPNHYNYSLMSNFAGNYQSYSFADKNQSQSIEFTPNVTTRIGLYFGWRWIFLGYTFDTQQLFHNTKKKANTELTLSLYSSKIGVDLFYRRTGNDFKINRLSGFNDKEETFKPYIGQDFNGLKASMEGFNLYYIWNNDHFSYPAAYSQSTNQKISCGSWIAGISWSKHNIDFDISQLPDAMLLNLADNLWFSKVKYYDLNINMGYTYNWVFARHCLFNISFTPAIAYKTSEITAWDDNLDSQTQKYHNFNFDLIGRAALVYNNKKYYAGILSTIHGFNYKQNTFEMFNLFTNFQVYAGFNFTLKKEYRKKK